MNKIVVTKVPQCPEDDGEHGGLRLGYTTMPQTDEEIQAVLDSDDYEKLQVNSVVDLDELNGR